MGVFWSNCRIKVVLTEEKMGATRFFIFSTFLVLMFGFALSLPTVGNEDPEQVSGEGLSRMIRALEPASNGTPKGLLTRFRRSPYTTVRDRKPRCRYVRRCSTVNGKRKCRRVRRCN